MYIIRIAKSHIKKMWSSMVIGLVFSLACHPGRDSLAWDNFYICIITPGWSIQHGNVQFWYRDRNILIENIRNLIKVCFLYCTVSSPLDRSKRFTLYHKNEFSIGKAIFSLIKMFVTSKCMLCHPQPIHCRTHDHVFIIFMNQEMGTISRRNGIE